MKTISYSIQSLEKELNGDVIVMKIRRRAVRESVGKILDSDFWPIANASTLS